MNAWLTNTVIFVVSLLAAFVIVIVCRLAREEDINEELTDMYYNNQYVQVYANEELIYEGEIVDMPCLDESYILDEITYKEEPGKYVACLHYSKENEKDN